MSNQNKMAAPVKPDLGLLEEDDEFEEFPAEDWTGEDEEPDDINVWEDNWDDDNIDDDFSKQLRAELEKQGKSLDSSEPMKT
ncbi:26S proteasome complex subunit SEM1-like [Biomphalaria glabrata]|uniref:26S proteasome complex subunit SEM1 n=2 Tax=Biomphalaria TaxID=6525 RepID=A0A9W2YDP5_BIOGL|nr:26S proteasome complex subunit SEM1-like [Biomphalaria glabrata]